MRFLRGLSGRVLACGCLVGVYETYDGVVVATIDARGDACQDVDHRLHTVVPAEVLDDRALASSGHPPSAR
ncbi:MAG TPA: hypothetical protein VLT86_16570 [Vicinamibacterales bacterium]|nr:hypothetical protein [Vicinamibacterales bacterium]